MAQYCPLLSNTTRSIPVSGKFVLAGNWFHFQTYLTSFFKKWSSF
ncbi:hypothetical protein MCAV_06780 [[Mycoplasma] cavipharyngis]